MRNIKRQVAGALIAVVVTAVATGCIQMEEHIAIRSQKDLDIVYLLGIENAAARAAELTWEDLCYVDVEEISQTLAAKAITINISDAKTTGCSTLYQNVSAKDIGLTLSLKDGIYTLGAADAKAEPGEYDEYISKYKVVVDFPGKVLSHSGSSKVSGRTVTWTDPADPLYATALADPNAKIISKGKANIGGTVAVGKELTAKASEFTPKPDSYKYQWYRDGVAIKGATAAAYLVKKADAGTKLSVEVTAKKNGYVSRTVLSGTKSVPTPKK